MGLLVFWGLDSWDWLDGREGKVVLRDVDRIGL